jgi:hypothetical protein
MAESLRDQLAANFDKITTSDGGGGDAPVDAPIEPATPAAPPSSRITEAKPVAAPAAAPAPAVGGEKPRDPETGQFVKDEAPKKPQEVKTAAKIHKAPAAPAPGSPQAEAALPQAPAKPRPQRPSSWKKEFWPHWDTLDPTLAEYLHTRESQFASGVSAYKAEAESAKPIVEAVQPFMEELKQHNLEPSRWITELGHVHRILALGNPAQKLQTIARVAQAYGVPLQALYDQQAQQQYLQQGQFQQPLQAPQQPQQQPLTAEAAEKLFQQKFLEVDSNREIQRFAADTAKHPHYDEVRQTMSQLLEANLADDLESAYQKALRMPEYEHLAEADREQVRQAQEEARRQAEAQRVLKAKGKAVSPASATPSGPGSEDKPKGLRSSIESAFETHAVGRV